MIFLCEKFLVVWCGNCHEKYFSQIFISQCCSKVDHNETRYFGEDYSHRLTANVRCAESHELSTSPINLDAIELCPEMAVALQFKLN